jgi:hypothetical protein
LIKAKVHAASVFDRDGIKGVLHKKQTEEPFLCPSHLWLDAGYNGKGKGIDWAEKTPGLTVDVALPPRRWVWVPRRTRNHRRGPLSRCCRGGG